MSNLVERCADLPRMEVAPGEVLIEQGQAEQAGAHWEKQMRWVTAGSNDAPLAVFEGEA